MASYIKFQLKVAEHSFAGVNGNTRDGACFKLEQTNMVAKILHIILIITEQLYYWLSKNSSVKIWSNKFQMVMINYNKLCANL